MAREYRHMADAGLGEVSAVVSSLPVGYTLGDTRVDSKIKYKLVYNAGNSQILPGNVAVPVLSGAGPYSCTVTSTSKGFGHLGGVLCHNATATTGTYFWGVTRGYIASGVIGDNASTPTGSPIAVGTDGSVNLMPQSSATGKVAIGHNAGAVGTITTGARTGDVYIQFE